MQNVVHPKKAKPDVIPPVRIDTIPTFLRDTPRWLLWKYDKDDRKIPLNPNGSGYASSTNPATWAPFFVAMQQYSAQKTDGIGFVFTEEDNVVGIDVDHCRNPETGELNEFAKLVLTNIQGYAEVSPSQTGIKIFTRSNDLPTGTNHEVGLECYSKGRYFTVTGQAIKNDFPDQAISTSFLHSYLEKRAIGKVSGFATLPDPDYNADRVKRELLDKLDPDLGSANQSYSFWLAVGQALHHQFEGSDEGLELWDLWSNQDGASAKYRPGECEQKWRSFNVGGGITLNTVRYYVRQQERTQALEQGEILWTADENVMAEKFLSMFYLDADDNPCLLDLDEELYAYTNNEWRPISFDNLVGEVFRFLGKVKDVTRSGELVPLKVSYAKASSLAKSIRALINRREISLRPRFWTDAPNEPAEQFIPVANGILNFQTGEMQPNTARLFATHALPFAYDTNAQCPTWTAFLNSLWPDDFEAQQCFAEMFGYILSGDLSQQKIFQIVGPKRAGKGTIVRTLDKLLGGQSVYSLSSLEMLTKNFGLGPALHSRLITVPDAQAPTVNHAEIAGLLLSISGQDPLTVDRKYKRPISVSLSTHILLCSNKPLIINEAAGALASRFINFELKHSFYNKEDFNLDAKIERELPGVFAWAMRANATRLLRGGRLIEPASSKSLIEEVTLATQPLDQFFQECIDVTNPEGVTFKSDLFETYQVWARKNGTRILQTRQKFSIDFKAHLRNLGVLIDERRKFKSATKLNEYYYAGIGLTEYGQTCLNGTVDFSS